MARPVTQTALGLAGILRRPGQAPVPVEAMSDAVEMTAAELHGCVHRQAMIGLDTNALIRLLTQDDVAQASAVQARLEPLDATAESVLLNNVVLVDRCGHCVGFMVLAGPTY